MKSPADGREAKSGSTLLLAVAFVGLAVVAVAALAHGANRGVPAQEANPGVPAAALQEASTAVPLASAEPSLEAVGRRVVEAVVRGDLVDLRSLSVGRSEYRAYLYPTTPFARGAVDRSDFAYDNLTSHSDRDLRRALAELSGKPLRFSSLHTDAGKAETHPGMVVHRGVVITVEGDGTPRRLDLVGGILEAGGRFKIVRYVDR
jgi:hypothetical protein